MRTLYIVVHNPNGGIGHQQIGQALVEADFDATLTKLALRLGCEPLASFTIYSRRQAAAAIQELEELGDVDVDPRDFDPEWFDPLECLATVDRLLEQRGRAITTRVRIELDFLRRAFCVGRGVHKRYSWAYILEYVHEQSSIHRPDQRPA